MLTLSFWLLQHSFGIILDLLDTLTYFETVNIQWIKMGKKIFSPE